MKVIVIQAAMDSEMDCLLEYFKFEEKIIIAGYEFYVSMYKGNKIIISKTQIGIINATCSTTIAIDHFKPDLIINQGCAGAHRADIEIGTIIIGEKSVYINVFVTNTKGKGEGSNTLEWLPHQKRSYLVDASPDLAEIAMQIDFPNKKLLGIIGSGDVFSKEFDRIEYLHKTFGEMSEDMETVASYRVCEMFNVEHIAFRIISNNELIGTDFDETVTKIMQKFVIKFIDKVI